MSLEYKKPQLSSCAPKLIVFANIRGLVINTIGQGRIITVSGLGRRSILDMSDFTLGWGGWSFEQSLLGRGVATADLVGTEELFSSCVVQFSVEEANDGGFVFIRRRLLADEGSLICNAMVSWWITEPQAPGVPWTSMVYAGAPNPFDNPVSMTGFDLLEGQTDVIPGTESPSGVGLQYGADFGSGIPELQICLGWKIPRAGQGTARIVAILIEVEQES